jgi:hypothetical protein
MDAFVRRQFANERPDDREDQNIQSNYSQALFEDQSVTGVQSKCDFCPIGAFHGVRLCVEHSDLPYIWVIAESSGGASFFWGAARR